MTTMNAKQPVEGWQHAWRSLALPVALAFVVLLAACAAPGGPSKPPTTIPTAPREVVALQPTVRYADREAVEELAQAIDQRLAIMRDVAAAKYVSGAPVQDAAREAVVLQQAGERARALGLDVGTVQAFFNVQMRHARIAQEQWLATWRNAGQCEPCATPVPLAAVRERIDAANERQLAALYLLAPLREDATAALLEHSRAALTARGFADQEAAELAAAASVIKRGAPAGALDRITATRALRIATTGDYAPFSLERDGQLTGADIQMGRALAAHLGAEPQFVRTSWPRLLDDLRDGRFDVAISGIALTPERAALGLYSSPYQVGGKTLIARCGERMRFDTPDELDQPGVRVIVNPGGTNERYVREHVRRAQVIVHPDNRGVFAEIAAGRADVMVTDDVEAELQSRRWPGQLCRTYPGTLTQGDKRILMARDPVLQSAVDAWLQSQIAAGEPLRMLEQAMHDYVRAPATH
jgi:cyclohexadienyl dehydratase